MSALAATSWVVLQRDGYLLRQRPGQVLLPLVFGVLACSLFPLAVGPEPELLRRMAGGVVWVCALLSSLLSLHTVFMADWQDGTLDQMLLAQPMPVGIVLAKSLVHWLGTGLPWLLLAPLLGLLMGLPSEGVWVLWLGLLLGSPVLSLLGVLGAALTLGLRHGAMLQLLLLLPLCVPVLVFGAGAVQAQAVGLPVVGHLYLLLAVLLLTVPTVPWAAAMALRVAL